MQARTARKMRGMDEACARRRISARDLSQIFRKSTDRKRARHEKHDRSNINCKAASGEVGRFCNWRGSPGSPPGFWGDENYRQGNLGRAEESGRSDSGTAEGRGVGN